MLRIVYVPTMHALHAGNTAPTSPIVLPFSHISLPRWHPHASYDNAHDNENTAHNRSEALKPEDPEPEGSRKFQHAKHEFAEGDDVRSMFFQLRGRHGSFESFQELHECSDGRVRVRRSNLLCVITRAVQNPECLCCWAKRPLTILESGPM